MTVTEALDYLRRMFIEETAVQPNWTDMELYKLIEAKANEAAEFGLIEAKDTSLTTTASTADYAYPSGVLVVRRVLCDGIPLKYIPFRQFEMRQPNGVAVTGTPREFTQWAETLTLSPTPSVSAQIVTLYCEKSQSSISSASSTIDIPAVFHHRLLEGVIADMFAKDQSPALSSKYENRWENIHKPSMRRFAKKRRRNGLPITVTDADSSLETDYGVI